MVRFRLRHVATSIALSLTVSVLFFGDPQLASANDEVSADTVTDITEASPAARGDGDKWRDRGDNDDKKDKDKDKKKPPPSDPCSSKPKIMCLDGKLSWCCWNHEEWRCLESQFCYD